MADSDHDWVYVGYIINISPDRPPILNLENFSSSEAGTPVNDPKKAAQVNAFSMNMNNIQLIEHLPPSYPSSNEGSIRAPDGPERKDPPNRFLAVVPAPGLGEMEHRRRASFDEIEDQLNNSLSRWAKTLPPTDSSFHAEWEGPIQGGFLPLSTRIVGPTDSARATRGKSSGTPSASTSSGSGGASSGWRGSDMDPTAEMGSWIGDSVWGSWPPVIDDEAIDEDDD